MQLFKNQLLVGMILGSAVLFSACSQTAEPSMDADETVTKIEVNDRGVQNIAIDAFKYGYSVEQIHVQPGDTVSIELSNSNGIHDFVIDELNVASKQINTGEKDTVTFTIPEDAVGKSYEYYCSVANHKALGMVGKIVVAEKGSLSEEE